jgi:enoyl-CoA hydratase/carnithine racemase
LSSNSPKDSPEAESSAAESSAAERADPETGTPPPGGRVIIDEPAPGVARLTISNPVKRGALDHPILDAFAEELPRLDARCVVITGEERIFSAGYDLGGLPDAVLADEAERLIAHPFAAAIDAIEAYPYPTLAAINGHAIGGGLELALSCDLRIAAQTARFGMPPAKLGLVYSHTGLRKFIDVIGAARTRELFLRGGRVDATSAETWGLVNWVVLGDELADSAIAIATELAGNAPLAQRGNKRVIGAVLEASAELDPDVEHELIELRRACFSSEDFREAVRAFAEKRPPRWQGR